MRCHDARAISAVLPFRGGIVCGSLFFAPSTYRYLSRYEGVENATEHAHIHVNETAAVPNRHQVLLFFELAAIVLCRNDESIPQDWQ